MIWKRRWWCGCLALAGLAGTGWGQVTLVDGGSARAVVVTALQPLPIAVYAAQELVTHVERATGVRLKVVTEEAIPDVSAGRIYVGATQAARAAGIDAESLPSEVAVLRTVSNALFIVGRDGAGAALDFNNPWSGTLWGVYELLEREAGVLWLWPGDLGTVVPGTKRLAVEKLDERVTPRFARRSLRPFTRGNDPRLGFTKDGLRQYVEAERIFLRRQRMGRSGDPRPYTGHSFTGWWKQYGVQHPEWFEMKPDGSRGPVGSTDRFVMCVSNPDLQKEIVRRFSEARKKAPSAPPVLSIGENDRHAVCGCETCRAWDDPEPDAGTLAALPRYARSLYHPYNSGARYARFWKAVYDEAYKVDTNVVVTALIYSYYSVAPLQKIALNPNIVLAFCPYGPHTPVPPSGESVSLLTSLFGGSQRNWWFPRYPEEQDWIKGQWDQWRATGATLYLRPNYTLDGYAMPHAYAHQFADQFQYFAAHGMLATDFDSLLGQWAAQGPTLYLLARLHTRPGAPVEELLTEYYDAFGPAAPHVRAYFDYWERHTTALLPRIESVLIRYGAAQWGTYPRMAHELFPPEAFREGDAILSRADAAVAKGSPGEYRDRVAYLRDGSTHARLCAEAAALFADNDATADQRRVALDKLGAFRKSVEGKCIANYQPLCQEELRSWGGSPGFAVNR
jgi:hypothetical protein